MAAIVSVTNGVTQEDESHFNQYAQTFSNVLGVTDTAQDALGRLVFPRAALDPGTPSEAQVYFNTDSLSPKITRDGVFAPFGIRQVVFNQYGGSPIDIKSATEVLVLEQTITTTGGKVLILARVGVLCTGDEANNTTIDITLKEATLGLLARGDQYLTFHAAGYQVGVVSPINYLDETPIDTPDTYTYRLYANDDDLTILDASVLPYTTDIMLIELDV